MIHVTQSLPKNLQIYLQEKLAHKLTELQQSGGDVVEWNDTSISLTATDQSTLNCFISDVLTPLEEKADYLSEEHWKKLFVVDSNKISFFSQLINKFPEVKIVLDHGNKSITFIGLHVMVEKARNMLFQEIYRKLCLTQ